MALVIEVETQKSAAELREPFMLSGEKWLINGMISPTRNAPAAQGVKNEEEALVFCLQLAKERSLDIAGIENIRLDFDNIVFGDIEGKVYNGSKATAFINGFLVSGDQAFAAYIKVG